MTDKIIERLKTGAIKNVYAFGGTTQKQTPYIVVKPESGFLEGQRDFRIFVHMPPGQQLALEDYTFNTLSVLLPDGYQVITRNGNVAELLQTQEYSDIITNNDDGTISMERRFMSPFILF